MVLRHSQNISQKDIEITITYPMKNKIVERIISFIKSIGSQIECFSDNYTKMVNVSDVYYIESIDKKTIVFCENDIYQINSRLYQIYEKLKDKGFVQISKYCILNINKLEKIKHLANRHLEAILSNGKHLYVTRKYLPDIINLLKEGE
jgi:DNA-binding LytR/AlgR family response regulator